MIVIIKIIRRIMIIILVTMKIINNKTMYMKCMIDMKDMLLHQPIHKLSNKQKNIAIKQNMKKSITRKINK